MTRDRKTSSRQTLISKILLIVLVNGSYAANNDSESVGVQFLPMSTDLRIYLAAPSGVFVAQLSAINTRDPLSKPVYNMDSMHAGTEGDSQYFSVEQTSGNLTTKRYIDRPVGSSYNISVIASTKTDQSRINLTILVSEYNRFPPVFQLVQYTKSLDLMTAVNDTIITVRATDRDVQPYNANITYAIQSSGLLTINRRSGEVTLRKKLRENKNVVSTLFAIDGGSPVRVTKAKLTITVKTISAPLDVVSNRTAHDFISLCWKKPLGGEPLGYVLFLRMEDRTEGISSQDGRETPPVFVEESTRNITVDMLNDPKYKDGQICHILHDLEFSKEYHVRVAGWNTKEIGILTEPFSFKTFENRTVCPSAQDVDSCYCMPGYYGEDCSLFDPCLATEFICDNGGLCVSNSKAELSCICGAGLIGENCELFDPCYVSPCLNGVCRIVNTSNYVCDCYSGYTDLDCGTDVKKSFASPRLTAAAVEAMGKTLEDATRDPYLIDAALFVSTANQMQEMLVFAYQDIHIAQSMINIISNLMSVNESVLEDNMFTRNQSITYALVETIEIFITNTIMERRSNLTINSPNLAIEVSEIGLDNSEVNFQHGITFSPKHTKAMFSYDSPQTSKESEEFNNISINIPKEALFMASSNRARVYFVSFKNSKLFRSTSTSAAKRTQTKSDAPVLIASISNVTVRNLTDAVSYIFPNDHVGRKQTCVYWSQESQEWRQEGLTTNQGDENIISCESIHLTAFSVLLDPDPDNVISEQHQMILSMISYVGSSCSIVGLILTIITYSMFRCLNRDRSAKILLNLCVSLMMMNISFVLIAVEQHVHVANLCMAIAMSTHYFVLTSLSWMLVEATNMYQLLITVFATTETRFMLKRMLCAWGLPFLVVALTAVSDITSYQAEDDKGCLLTPKHPYAYYFAYLGPSCIILAINCAVFVLVIRTVFQRRIARNVPVVSDRTTTMAQVRGAITVMTLLGVAWVFGALAMGHFKLAFQYVFCIFNSLQGFIIFVVRCAQYSEARLAWSTLFRTGSLKKYRGVLPTSSSRHTSSSFSHSAKSTESHSIRSLWHQIFSKKNDEKNKTQSFSNFNLRNNFGNQQLANLPLKELHDVSSDSGNQEKKDDSLPRKSALFVTEFQLQSALPFSDVEKVLADTDSDSLRSKQLSFNNFNRQENLSLDNINIAWSHESLKKMEGEITSWQFMKVSSPKKKSGASKSSKYRNSNHSKNKSSITKTV